MRPFTAPRLIAGLVVVIAVVLGAISFAFRESPTPVRAADPLPGLLRVPSALRYRSALPSLAADTILSPTPPASGPMPVPILVVTGTELYQDFTGAPYVRYWLSIANAHSIPDSFFAGPYSCDPPRVSIRDASTDVHIYGSCGGDSAPGPAREALYEHLWFGVKKGAPPPAAVYVRLYDTGTKVTYDSTVATVPVAPPDTPNGVTALAVDGFTCAPSSTPGACRTGADSHVPGFELRLRLTYDYDGSYGPAAELTVGVLWAYGTCLINSTELTRPAVGQPSQTVITVGTRMANVSNCSSIPSITDRIYAIRGCLSRTSVVNVATDCKEVPYDQSVTFARN